MVPTSVGFLLFSIKKQLQCGITTNLLAQFFVNDSYFALCTELQTKSCRLQECLQNPMLAHLGISTYLFGLSTVHMRHHYF